MYPEVKKFLSYRYVAIKRYGEKRWSAFEGQITINPSYTVSAGECEKGNFGDAHDKPYVFELSNGTKFIAFFNDCLAEDEILSEYGERANSLAKRSNFEAVKRNIDKLNGFYYEQTDRH